jgi:hypothetical protein
MMRSGAELYHRFDVRKTMSWQYFLAFGGKRHEAIVGVVVKGATFHERIHFVQGTHGSGICHH